MARTSPNELSLVLITLFKGVMYREQDESLWQALLDLHARVRDHVGVLGLELRLDESEGYAYLRQKPDDENEETLPRIVARRPLGYSLSLLLVLLRKKLVEHDAGGEDRRLVLSTTEICDTIRTFLPETTNEAKLVDRVSAEINKAVDMGFLRRLRAKDDHFEVQRILQSFVDAQWLSEFDARLAEYREHAGERDGGEG